jgi:catechol 2,3-dioxygenase-like lactoylglutathione lyase family enzyme
MTLHMIELTVADVARSVAWYQGVCRLTVARTDEPNGFVLFSREAASSSNEAACGFALKQGTPPAVGGVRLHFLVADLNAELDRLAARGVHPESALKTSPEGYRRAAFRDPDGHAVTLFEWVTSSPTPERP